MKFLESPLEINATRDKQFIQLTLLRMNKLFYSSPTHQTYKNVKNAIQNNEIRKIYFSTLHNIISKQSYIKLLLNNKCNILQVQIDS